MGTLSVTWRESQAAVGCSVTAVRMIFMRSWLKSIPFRPPDNEAALRRRCARGYFLL